MKKTIIILTILFCVNGFAQDPQFSQPYASPVYLNPALTGDTPMNRLAMTYRKQWANIAKGYTSYVASFDRNIHDSNSGLGGYVLYDKSGTHGMKVTAVNFSYSYDVQIDEFSGLKAGIGFGYSFMNFNNNDQLYADQVIRNGAATSIESNILDGTDYFDMSAGLMYYNRSFWIGSSMSHLNRPNVSLNNQANRLPMHFSLHGGVKLFAVKNEWGQEKSYLNLVAHYKYQGEFDQVDLGVYYNFKPIIFGVWYRGIPLIKSYHEGGSNNESIILLAGIEIKDEFRVAYSYDITISQLSGRSGGSHEISIIYEWTGKTKPRRLRLVSCPKF